MTEYMTAAYQIMATVGLLLVALGLTQTGEGRDRRRAWILSAAFGLAVFTLILWVAANLMTGW